MTSMLKTGFVSTGILVGYKLPMVACFLLVMMYLYEVSTRSDETSIDSQCRQYSLWSFLSFCGIKFIITHKSCEAKGEKKSLTL